MYFTSCLLLLDSSLVHMNSWERLGPLKQFTDSLRSSLKHSWINFMYLFQKACRVKFGASRFAPFWNEIVRNLWEEDYINELELPLMPKNKGGLPIVQWPLFLLASKVFLAKDIAVDCKTHKMNSG